MSSYPHPLLRPAILQRIIQTGFFGFCLLTGWQFYRYFLWATGAADVYTPRPASVEAFLPIAALMGLRRLLETGQWDSVHPAGLTLLLAALGIAMLLRKGFCGYICPVGLISGLLNTMGRKLGFSRVPGRGVMRTLSLPKYLVLGFFLFTVCIGMDARAIEEFSAAPYNYVADARMLQFFLHPSRTTLIVLAVLMALGVFARSFWCCYLCPYGALLGLFSWFSPARIHRDEHTCIGCGRCTNSCPGCITVQDKKQVLSPECLGCLRCQEACPVDGCITLRVAVSSMPGWLVGAGSIALLLGAWLAALSAGVWNQNVPLPMLQKFYQIFLG